MFYSNAPCWLLGLIKVFKVWIEAIIVKKKKWKETLGRGIHDWGIFTLHVGILPLILRIGCRHYFPMKWQCWHASIILSSTQQDDRMGLSLSFGWQSGCFYEKHAIKNKCSKFYGKPNVDFQMFYREAGVWQQSMIYYSNLLNTY